MGPGQQDDYHFFGVGVFFALQTALNEVEQGHRVPVSETQYVIHGDHLAGIGGWFDSLTTNGLNAHYQRMLSAFDFPGSGVLDTPERVKDRFSRGGRIRAGLRGGEVAMAGGDQGGLRTRWSGAGDGAATRAAHTGVANQDALGGTLTPTKASGGFRGYARCGATFSVRRRMVFTWRSWGIWQPKLTS